MAKRRRKPRTNEEWLSEIAAAFADAREAIPFAALTGEELTEAKLFHLAPAVAVKFRGLEPSRRHVATEAALASYVATQSPGEATLDAPVVAFGFCYLVSHLALDLLDEKRATDLLDFVLDNAAELCRLTDPERCRVGAAKGKRRTRQ